MASDKSYERLMKYFDNLQRTINDTRDGISKMHYGSNCHIYI